MDNVHNNQDVVMAAWRAFATRDPSQVAAVFTEDAEWLAPKDNATAVALDGTAHMIGRDAIVHFITSDFGKLFVADVQIDFRRVYADGDTVIIEDRFQATLSNGRHYDNDYCFFFELRDGRIPRVREYMDTQRGRECIFG